MLLTQACSQASLELSVCLALPARSGPELGLLAFSGQEPHILSLQPLRQPAPVLLRMNLADLTQVLPSPRIHQQASQDAGVRKQGNSRAPVSPSKSPINHEEIAVAEQGEARPTPCTPTLDQASPLWGRSADVPGQHCRRHGPTVAYSSQEGTPQSNHGKQHG